MKSHRANMMIAGVLGLALIGSLMGCEATGPAGARSAAIEAGPLIDAHGRARSLVFDSPRLSAALARMPSSEELPWYATRSDARAATPAGIRSSTLERAVTVTRDRQRSFDGRIFNSTTRTTYHARRTQTIR